MFITESWFWRGTQSAIFYYVSCSPYVEYKHKRQRRKDAERSRKEKEDIVTTQPGAVVQPGPFQTNPDWAEEIIRGPGPPKGWKAPKVLKGYTEEAREKYRQETQAPQPPIDFASEDPVGSRGEPNTTKAHLAPNASAQNTPTVSFADRPNARPTRQSLLENGTSNEPTSPVSDAVSDTSSSSSALEHAEHAGKSRPSVDRRLSSAVGNLKETIKGWNLRRYEREDDILPGLNERFSRLWDKATNYAAEVGAENKKISFVYGRKRAGTNDSDRIDWERAVRNPEINDLHPPVVSRLPATRQEAAWMLLPPPSAAVMEAKRRPKDEPGQRWPLAIIGRNAEEWEQLKKERDRLREDEELFEHRREVVTSRASASTVSTVDTKRTPDLSHSSSDEGSSDEEGEDGEEEEEEEEDDDTHKESAKRHSAPVDGWMPVMSKRVERELAPTPKPWRGNRSWQQQPAW